MDDPVVHYDGSSVGSTASRRFLMPDERGSIIALADAAGNRTAINAYDEYGIPGSANQGRFQYTGQAWLPELGMYHYKARIYSPTLGRFLQVDPIGYDDQINLYAYVGNDPMNNADPSGSEAACNPCIDPNLSLSDIADRFLTALDVVAVGVDLVVGGPTGESGAVLAATAVARNALRQSPDAVASAARTKTYQTYTKHNPTTNTTYSGKTSGTGTPAQNVARRDSGHHMNAKGYGPARLDRSSRDPQAIRGREQQLIDKHGGAQSKGGSSGNKINGISDRNPARETCRSKALKEFGPC